MLSKSAGTRTLQRANLVEKHLSCDWPHLMSEQSFSTPQLGTSRTINYNTPFAIYQGGLESWLRCRRLHHKCLNLERQLSPTCLFPGFPGTS